MVPSGRGLVGGLLRSLFVQPLTQLAFTKQELWRLVTRPIKTVLTAVVSAVVGLAAYSWWLDGARFTETLVATDSLTATAVFGLVPTTALTPVVVTLAVVFGLLVLVSMRGSQRMESQFGPRHRP
jgi:hypothetical protein